MQWQLYKTEIRKNLKLAYPVILGQVGHMVTQIADTLMVGQIGAAPLASASFANAIFAILLVISIGVASGITTLVGNAHGEKDSNKVISIVGNGYWSTLLFAAVFCILALFCRPFLFFLGQEESVVNHGMDYLTLMFWSIIPLVGFLSLKHFFDGLEWTKPGMFISIAANLLNILLNYIFIFGKFGLAPMGLYGAGLATLISRIVMAFLAFLILLKHKKLAIYKNALHQFRFSVQTQKEIFKLGIPISAQYFLEAGAFILAAIVIGWVGPNALAAHQIAINIASFTYMFATGISATATIRISNIVGAKNYKILPFVSKSLFIMIVGVESVFAIIIVLSHHWLPTLFVKDLEVSNLAASLLLVAAFFQLTDGIQVLAMGALRGLSDVKRPTTIALISYWIISLPLGYFFMKTLNLGAIGVWIGLLIGLSTAAVLLSWRFFALARKTIKRFSEKINEPNFEN